MGARKTELVVVGGPAPRRQAARKAGWTKAKELRFLEALSDTCNVRLSATRARVANGTVYKRRAKDAAFRDGWARALAQGYARLEIETLERAINGTMRTIVHKDGREEVVVEHSDRVAGAAATAGRGLVNLVDDGGARLWQDSGGCRMGS